MRKVIIIILCLTILPLVLPLAAEGFTNADRKLLYEMNIRIQETDKRLNQRIDDLQKFMQMMMAVFSALILGTLSFAFWDRKTSILKESHLL